MSLTEKGDSLRGEGQAEGCLRVPAGIWVHKHYPPVVKETDYPSPINQPNQKFTPRVGVNCPLPGHQPQLQRSDPTGLTQCLGS